MPALKAGFCIIGYFIPVQTSLSQENFCLLIHLPFRLLVRKAALIPIFRKERRSFFDHQTVCRDMLRHQIGRYPKRIQPLLKRLTRKAGHQIHIYISKARLSYQIITCPEVFICMNSSEQLQKSVVCGLKSQADPVHSKASVKPDLLSRQSSRITFYRHFRLLLILPRQILFHTFRNPAEQIRFQDRRRSASEKD